MSGGTRARNDLNASLGPNKTKNKPKPATTNRPSHNTDPNQYPNPASRTAHMPDLAIIPIWLILSCADCGEELETLEAELVIRTRDDEPPTPTQGRPTQPPRPFPMSRAAPSLDADLAALDGRRRAFGVVPE